jgi:hypothetical protein
MRIPSIAFFTVVLVARAALPCSPALPSLDGPTAPDDGASGIPTNARIVVAFDAFGGTPNVTDVILRDDEGTETRPAFGAEGSLFIVRPTGLRDDATYTLVLNANDFGVAVSAQRTFTTTNADDVISPLFVGELESPTYTFEPKAAFGQGFDSCGFNSVDRYFVDIDFPAVNDDVGIAGFHIHTIDENGGRTLRETSLDASATGRTVELNDPGTVTFVVEAFDFAGNSTFTNEVEVVLMAPLISCSALHATTTATPVAALATLAVMGLTMSRRVRRRERR